MFNVDSPVHRENLANGAHVEVVRLRQARLNPSTTREQATRAKAKTGQKQASHTAIHGFLDAGPEELLLDIT
jgi:hypothetical protein